MSLIGIKYYNYSLKNHKNSLSIRDQPDYYKHSLKNRGTSRCTCPKAVLTVEAAAVLPFFVCFMVFVLYFFRILQVQAHVAQALQYAGRKTAAEYSLQLKEAGGKSEDSDFEKEDILSTGSGIVTARLLFQKQLKKQGCPTAYIQNGMAGISLAQSDLSDNYVELKAIYKMKFPVGLLGKIQYRIAQEAKCRKWTGYQPGQDTEEDDTWLYYTEYGTVYHASRTCTHLDLSIRGVTSAQAQSSRNSSGGKYHACEKCADGAAGGMVYITNYGNRYHKSLTCSGLKRSVFMIRRSKALEKRMCSKCGG